MHLSRTKILRMNRAAGFTLIELMIVVVVIAILGAIAYPSYQDHVRKGRRAQAKADLVEYAQLAERYHTANNSYLNFTVPSSTSPRDGNGVYTIGGAFNANTFSITASPIVGTDQTKDTCGGLAIDQAGVKTSSGPVATCW